MISQWITIAVVVGFFTALAVIPQRIVIETACTKPAPAMQKVKP